MTEHKFCGFGKIQLKEDAKDFHVSGFVATSHPDRAEGNGFAGDIIPKTTLGKLVEQINNRYKPEAGAVSYRHDWIKDNNANLPLAGAISSPVVLKAHPDYEGIKSEIEQGVIPGFSIEYISKGQIPMEKEGKKYRMLTDIDLLGFGFANRRMIANPHAEIVDFGYKEIMGLKENHCSECNEDMSDSSKESHMKKHKTGEKEMEQGQENKEEAKPQNSGVEINQYKVSAEDMALLAQFKEAKEKDAKVKEMVNSIAPSIKEAVATEIKELRKRSMPGVNTNADGKAELKELSDFKSSLTKYKEVDEPLSNSELGAWQARQSKHESIISAEYKEAAKLMTKVHSMGALYMGAGFLNGTEPKAEVKEVGYNPLGRFEVAPKIEAKALDTASNAGTQTD